MMTPPRPIIWGIADFENRNAPLTLTASLLVPGARFHLQDRGGYIDSDVVHQHVKRTKLFEGLLNGPMHIILIGYVTLDCTNPAFGPKTIGKPLRGPTLQVKNGNGGARFHKAFRDCSTDASGPARDECDLTSH